MSNFPENKRYEGVRFNVISVTRGWVGVQFPGKKRYVTLEWPLIPDSVRSKEESHTHGHANDYTDKYQHKY